MKRNPKIKASEPGNTIDPLYVVFEQHLFNFQDSTIDRKTFIKQVVDDYLTLLGRAGITTPPALEEAVRDELGIQVRTMLVKKIYGCLSIEEFRVQTSPRERQKAKKKYKNLKKSSDSRSSKSQDKTG